ncbi:uncharacterized protein LOC106163115 [Lingula anatina]|uniref:Uncharacterized protein LOC106163115 n=1 Tax=Lingula anatina TaxID=7574 RepID=A0A1S3IF47_LINAN|nr:uncharacterized protein LOC106163115 [Lingula anatina]|eukprot:XP_013396079.1 uncharacterized protein LOC106163115 [Lingula anatina]
MHLAVINITNETQLDISQMQATALKFYGFLHNEDNNITGSAAVRTKQNIRNFFSVSREVQVREIVISPTAIQFTLRAYNYAALSKLWKEQKEHTLGETLGNIVNDNYTLNLLQVQRLHFGTFMSQAEVENYRQVPLVYQENSHCSLDYTDVNKNIKGFIGYQSIFTMVIPHCVIFYCYLRILCRRSEPTQPGSEITTFDSKIVRVFATSALLNFMSQFPHVITNILFGMGIFIQPAVYFLLSIFPYSSLVVLGLMYWATFAADVCRLCCCCCPVENRSSETASMFEVSQVMLLRRNSSNAVNDRSAARVNILDSSA